MAHQLGAPLTTFGHFDPEEAEAAIALGVDLAAVDVESLRDGRLHLGHGARRLGVDVGADPVASVHDERALVHARLRRRDEVQVVRPPRPCRVNVRVGVEDGFQILPFACVPSRRQKKKTVSVRPATVASAAAAGSRDLGVGVVVWARVQP